MSVIEECWPYDKAMEWRNICIKVLGRLWYDEKEQMISGDYAAAVKDAEQGNKKAMECVTLFTKYMVTQ